MRCRTAHSIAALVLAPLLAGACGEDAGAPDQTTPVDVGWPGDGGATETFDLGGGLEAELPEAWRVTPFAEVTPSERNPVGCSSRRASLGAGQRRIDLELNDVSCIGVTGNGDIGDGDHGTYVSLADVPDPSEVRQHEVPAGSLTTLRQPYIECTDGCKDFTDTLALLTLDAPPDPDRPTLVILSPKGEASAEQLVALAEVIVPA